MNIDLREKMKDIRLLAFDLDDTLLRSDKTISQRTLSAIKSCRDMGIRCVCATARPIRTADGFLQEAKLDGAVYHNGAIICADGQRLPESAHIPFNVAQKLLVDWNAEHPGRQMGVEMNDVLYTNFDASALWKYVESIRTADFTDLPQTPVEKFIIQVKSESEEAQLRARLGSGLHGYVADGDQMFITSKDAVKSRALGILAAHWGLTLGNVAAFGDGVNDIDMLERCGVAVAVGNASPGAKAAADFVTDTNDNDGVAKFIEKFLL